MERRHAANPGIYRLFTALTDKQTLIVDGHQASSLFSVTSSGTTSGALNMRACFSLLASHFLIEGVTLPCEVNAAKGHGRASTATRCDEARGSTTGRIPAIAPATALSAGPARRAVAA
jgi:hypothetical protein